MELKEEELERFQGPAILIHEEGKSFTPEINSRRMKPLYSLCRVYSYQTKPTGKFAILGDASYESFLKEKVSRNLLNKRATVDLRRRSMSKLTQNGWVQNKDQRPKNEDFFKIFLKSIKSSLNMILNQSRNKKHQDLQLSTNITRIFVL